MKQLASSYKVQEKFQEPQSPKAQELLGACSAPSPACCLSVFTGSSFRKDREAEKAGWTF